MAWNTVQFIGVSVDECEEVACEGDFSDCINTEGSYECVCKPGYIMDPSSQTCSGETNVIIHNWLTGKLGFFITIDDNAFLGDLSSALI